MFFVCLISCVKQLSNCLTSFNLYGKASLFYHAYWIINNVHLNYKNSPAKQNPRDPIAMCFVVLSKVPYPFHAEMVQNSCCMFKLFDSWYILPTIPRSLYNYHTWQLYQHGWSRAIILLLHICTGHTKYSFICLTLILFMPPTEQEGLFSFFLLYLYLI